MDAFKTELARILELPVATVADELRLDAGVWDSMSMISCLAAIDRYFGIPVSTEKMATCETVADLMALLR